METGSSIMPLCATMFLSMSAVTTSGLPEITGGRRRVLTVSPVNGLMFHSAYIGGMNAPRLNDFAA